MSPAALSGISSATPSPALLAAARRADLGATPRPEAADVQRAAKQFEAILVRQLLAPAIEPMMNSSLGGNGSGGGVYGYMLTDVLANSISEGGGLGLASMLQKQLSSPEDTSGASARHE